MSCRAVRISNIDPATTKEDLYELLQNRGLSNLSGDPRMSLATGLQGLKVATVSFTDEGALSRALGLQPHERQLHGRCISLDKSFGGLTALSDGCDFDIVAIHGLNDHAFDTWQDASSSFMWLRDSLPGKFPGARVLLYGYNPDMLSDTLTGRLCALASMFLEHLRRERDSERQRKRPLIVMAHSLGGLIIKQVLLTASNRTDARFKDIIESIRGIMFFGTPQNKGNDVSTTFLVCDILRAFNIDGLVDALKEWDVKPLFLYNSTAEFRLIIEQLGIVVHTFIEDQRTQIGRWPLERNIRLVDERSATLGAAREHKTIVPANHASLCKFKGATNPTYTTVCQGISELIADIKPVVTTQVASMDIRTIKSTSWFSQYLTAMSGYLADTTTHNAMYQRSEDLTFPHDVVSEPPTSEFPVLNESIKSPTEDDPHTTLSQYSARTTSAARTVNMYKRSFGQLASLCTHCANCIMGESTDHDAGVLAWYKRTCEFAESRICADAVRGLLGAVKTKYELHDLYRARPNLVRQHGAGFFPTQLTFRPDLDETLDAFRTALRSERDFPRLLALGGDDAQLFVDYVDQMLAILDRRDALWRLALDALRTLCARHEVCPASLVLPEGALERLGDAPIAMGGFADVWHGKVHDADVAIKVWRLGGHGADVLKDFCKEAAVLKYLRHPNVTRLVGVETTVFPMCLVCEWMPLGTLNSFLERHPGANRLALLVDVAAGLTYLHALDIVHGDLKGANILINARRSACLADFGLAAFSYENRTAYIPTRSVNAGTTRWIAPEVMDPEAFGLERARVSRESDVYAFAMVMWEAFTGRVPFPSIQRDAAVMHKVIGGGRPTRPFQATDLGLSDAVWDIVERCWQGDRGARPIISQVRDQLEQVVDVVEDLGAPQEWPLDVA